MEACLTLLLSQRADINVVQVGANDGLGGDPVATFIANHPGISRILLCEPQPEVAKLLRHNYRWHPEAFFFEGAICLPGENAGAPLLWRVQTDLWELVESKYSRKKNVPSHRAVSGFASLDRDHVVKHFRRYAYKGFRRKPSVETSIEGIEVPLLTFGQLVRNFPSFQKVDVLLVDTEGLDNQVVTSALAAGILPAIVYFENKHLSPSDFHEIRKSLEGHQYFILNLQSNTLAVQYGFGGPPRAQE